MQLNIFKQKDLISQRLLSYLLFELPHSEDGKLPPASVFAEKFGVSIVTIREILKAMESIGIISMHHGRGIFLNHPDTIAREMIETRILIESYCASLAAEKLTDEDATELNEVSLMLENAAHTGNMELYTDADFLFHMKISQISRNLVLEKTLRNIRVFLYVQQRETNRILIKDYDKSLREHKAVLESILSKNPVQAEKAMRGHLQKTMTLWENR